LDRNGSGQRSDAECIAEEKTKEKVPNKTRHQVVQRRCIDIQKKLQRYYGGLAQKANARIIRPFKSVKGIAKKAIRFGNAVTRALKGAEAIVRLPTKHLRQKKKRSCTYSSEPPFANLAVSKEELLLPLQRISFYQKV
jgi:hypothetical protein